MNKTVTVIKSHNDDVSDPDRTIKWKKGDWVFGSVEIEDGVVVVNCDEGNTWYFDSKFVTIS